MGVLTGYANDLAAFLSSSSLSKTFAMYIVHLTEATLDTIYGLKAYALDTFSVPLLLEYGLLITLCVLARLINVRAVTRMFFLVDEDEDVLTYKKKYNNESQKRMNGEQDPKILDSPLKQFSQIMIGINWAVGVTFMSSFSYCVAHYHSDISGIIPKFPFVLAILSLSYMLALFGVNHALGSLIPSVPMSYPVEFNGKQHIKIESSVEEEGYQSVEKQYKDAAKKNAADKNLSHTLAWVFLFGLALVCPFLFNLAFRLPSVRIAIRTMQLYMALGVDVISDSRFIVSSIVIGIVAFYKFYWSVPRNHTYGQKDPEFAKVPDHIRLKAFPPPFPNGWFKIAESGDIPIGKVKYVRALGCDFAVFRGTDGKARVIHAFCPHMGANMAGGEVKENLLECPFHGWKFNGDGKVEDIPYLEGEKIPECATTKSWSVRELHRQILIYFDAEGRDPPYEPHVAPELTEENFVYRGKVTRFVNMHIQDFAENSADTAHFGFLHETFPVPILKHFIKVKHHVIWDRDEEKKHVAFFTDTACLSFRGKEIPETQAFARITFDGPGGVVYFRFFTPIGRILLIKTFLPVEPLRQKVQDVWFAEPGMPKILVEYVVKNFLIAFDDDIDIWERKTWASKPLLVKGDGPMMRQRRWFEQFYSPSSRAAAGQKKLEW
eukprot:Nk52_evm4s233 gene=Nk52_evmTU4s233